MKQKKVECNNANVALNMATGHTNVKTSPFTCTDLHVPCNTSNFLKFIWIFQNKYANE